MRIGLLGGTFNPVHNGHLTLARTALKELDLDEIWFLPVGNHPLKNEQKLLPFDLRMKLLEMVLSAEIGMKASILDSDQVSLNFTDVLLKKLFKKFPDHDFTFLAGMDIVEELPRWHNYTWLLKNVRFVVFTRPGEKQEKLDKLEDYSKIIFVTMKPVSVSSTDIRRRIAGGEKISGLVPETIERILYQYYSDFK